MLVFGLFGYAAGKLGYPGAPFLLGVVLGPMLETNLRQSLLISQGDLGIFVAHPIAAALLALALVVMVTSVLVRLRRQPTPA